MLKSSLRYLVDGMTKAFKNNDPIYRLASAKSETLRKIQRLRSRTAFSRARFVVVIKAYDRPFLGKIDIWLEVDGIVGTSSAWPYELQRLHLLELF